MQKENEESDEAASRAFKNTLFAHAIGTNNPKLFFALYPQQEQYVEEDNEEEFFIPRNEEELQEQLRRFNVQRTV